MKKAKRNASLSLNIKAVHQLTTKQTALIKTGGGDPTTGPPTRPTK